MRGENDQKTLNDGFRRVLYDAMVLCRSLLVVRKCAGYPKPSPAEIDADVEAHHVNAMIQMRSMNDFFFCKTRGTNDDDTTIVTDFPGCSEHSDRLPAKGTKYERFAHVYVAHKSWEAAAKDESAGAAQMPKPEVIRLGRELLEAFEQFWDVCRKNGIGTNLKRYAAAYEAIYRMNKLELDKLAP
jgi:hypothetical protein